MIKQTASGTRSKNASMKQSDTIKIGQVFRERSASREREREGEIPNERQGSANKRSKEEQMELRKKMMKYNPMEASGMAKRKTVNIKEEEAEGRKEFGDKTKPSVPKPKPELLERLAKGEKAPVDKSEMHKLTKKNYDNLPEVKKSREEKEKKEELKRRVEKKKEFGKNLRARSRNSQEFSQEEE